MESTSYPEHLWRAFADFVAYEGAAGGPSPNLNLIASAAEHAGATDRADRTWLAGCYAAVYNTPATVLLWTEWPLERMLGLSKFNDLGDWLHDNWEGIVIHSNRRRTHANPYKLARGMYHLSRFAAEDTFESHDDYDQLWADVQGIPSIGRYFGIKLAGTLHALGLTTAKQYDIRARGAKNGRKSLSLLFDDESLSQKAGNKKSTVEWVDACSHSARHWLLETHGLRTTWFQFEALLCEFNQMVKGDRYPQKTSDADYDALEKTTLYFGIDHPAIRVVMEAREEILPEYAVIQKKRKDLLDIYSEHGYVWSDAAYDYGATYDLSDPVILDLPRTDWESLTGPRGAAVAAST